MGYRSQANCLVEQHLDRFDDLLRLSFINRVEHPCRFGEQQQ
jgi:hypothetical protein